MSGTARRDSFLESSPEIRRLQAIVDEFATRERPLRVLEAGCGSTSYISVGEDAHVTGIDISARQLERHATLDRKVLGDVQAHRFQEGEFDLVVCWDVLEHLPAPERAVASFAWAVRRGGLVVLALPNVLSLKGLVTKFTPHGFHVWVYRHLFGWEHAGRDDHGPFRTHLRWSIAPEALKRLAASHGLVEEYFGPYESWSQQQLRGRFRLTGQPWRVLRRATRTLTGGRVTPELTDYILVLRRA